jgi:uncharacterized protein
MNKRDPVSETAEFVKEKFANDSTGHDWWHLYRVWTMAKRIAEEEKGANMLVVELAALLHDIADWKFHDGDSGVGPTAAREWLKNINTDEENIDQVVYIIKHISFKGGFDEHKMQTLEGKIVQDADRLDALGAIGLARLFATGAKLGKIIHDPSKEYTSFEEYYKNISKNTMINHFYEKLLLLKDKMNTKTGKKIALHRHEYMERYLEEFYAEWDGKL